MNVIDGLLPETIQDVETVGTRLRVARDIITSSNTDASQVLLPETRQTLREVMREAADYIAYMEMRLQMLNPDPAPYPGLATMCLVLSDPALVCHQRVRGICTEERPHQVELCKLLSEI